MRRTPGMSRPQELSAQLEAEREGMPFLRWRDDDGAQVLLALEPVDERLAIGRAEECPVALPWDQRVSRTHAELVRVGADWTVEDLLSRNGTFVSGARVSDRRRLRDGDRIVVGGTTIAFADPTQDGLAATRPDDSAASIVELTPMQRRVLVALCRPLAIGDAGAVAASNAAIAGELVLSVETVKTHLKALYDKFDLGDVPPAEKRSRLAAFALSTGLVTRRDAAG